MLLTRCGCCLVSAIVIMVSIFGQSTAQNISNTTTIDLTSSRSRFTRMVIVPQVPLLRILLPESATLADLGSIQRYDDICPTVAEYQCIGVVPMNGFELRYTLDTLQTVNITVDPAYEVGCSNYMHPVDATTSSDAEVSLSCIPVPVNPADFEGNMTIEWRRFFRLEELQYFVRNCSDFPENCSSQFRDDSYLISRLNNETNYNLTIINPASSRAWYVPSFTVNGSRTYVAPYTFLYRWPTIETHYEFSLEVFEPASNYDRLECEAKSFPPLEGFAWTRDDTPIDSSFPRYTFTNVTTDVTTDVTKDERISAKISAKITISEVLFEDSALFTCKVANLGGLLETDVSLSVRLRVKHRLRPLWPAVGIVGVGILVALFIIIGHFYDKAVEKYQNEPSNPSHHKRLQSITSTADENSNNVPSGKKQSGSQANQVKYTVGGHVAVKRLSSQRIQLLEEPQ